MDKITVAESRKPDSVGRQVRLQGWVRTRRDSKGGFSFIELNDGSSQGNVQVIAGSYVQRSSVTIPVGGSLTTPTHLMKYAHRNRTSRPTAKRKKSLGGFSRKSSCST